MTKFHCRIRKYRKSLRLSQRELAHMLGLKSQGAVSEIEAGRKRPGLGVALACALLFDTTLPDLFPSLHAAIAAALSARLRDAEGRTTAASLKSAADRLGEPSSHL